MFFIWNLGSRQANLDAFEALNNAYDIVISQGSAELQSFFQQFGLHYPNSMGTERYAEPVLHPANDRVAMPVLPTVFSQASQALLDELWTLVPAPSQTVENLDPDWFPASETE